MTDPVTIETHVPVPLERAWVAYTDAEAITHWNFASPEWCCPSAQVDLRKGGRHIARMEAKDGSIGFDFAGTYEEVDAPFALSLRLDDGRLSRTTFEHRGDGTRVQTVFDPDASHPAGMQRDGWQAILDNYAAYVGQQERDR